MKNHIKKFLALMLVAATYSCSEESNMDPTGNWTLTDPTVIDVNNNIVLDETTPTATLEFSWEAAETSNDFGIAYTFVLVPAGTEDYSNPLLSKTSGNGGKDLSIEITHEELDRVLWANCYAAGEPVAMKWAVLAQAIETVTSDSQDISVTRFATEYAPATLYISGSGTEAGEDVADATLMRSLKDVEGDATQVYDVYTRLTTGGSYSFRHDAEDVSKRYGGSDGSLEDCGGPDIATPESTALYRVTANLEESTYEVLEVTTYSIVGDAVQEGWGGDLPLAYQGNGVWEGDVDFLGGGGFLFRMNQSWDYQVKRIVGTATSNNLGGDLVMASEADATGVSYQDIPGPDEAGNYTVTLELTGEGWSYNMVSNEAEPTATVIGETTVPTNDAVSGALTFDNDSEYDAPDQLYLLTAGGDLVGELIRSGNTFTSNYLALEAGETYTLNSANDGSGTTYNNVAADGEFAVARDQAYKLAVNFETGKLSWNYYNFKIYHWDNANGGWDSRLEIVMTYVHPYTFTVSGAELTAGYDTKFNSPWDIQFTTASSGLSGTMYNDTSIANYLFSGSDGIYEATIVVDDTYETCTYEFIKL